MRAMNDISFTMLFYFHSRKTRIIVEDTNYANS